ncbi:LytR/AlgR family response regulator transcription factor [Chitinophaga pinensis]|uniref:Two component transcriptional regulator, LytTR family n=1 Tax=Chitinophaga pinensis (strain ATCC 43595 / DSM 2588 / LMG 13176 / NBRC 15968 / NCIMB 11800 / UQM 2034) TaxID=485918 RepID=A0A979GR25_CHIPD|nr:LytTR family DNA-binding domain-containing protein [Chitinophaga pinensis]ACU58504.1 two component transcriptional regulator, LytTR family [Chitinophaga pinensis DSM 2588]
MIKAVIIDDERNSRDIISLMLEKYCPEVQVAATASDCADGIATIQQHQPQLVFLDLEMPDGTGFDVLLGTQDAPPFEAVFVTAFEKKFLHTIRFSEVEIILKPIDRESLMNAVSKIADRIHANASTSRYKVLLENFNNGRNINMDMVIPVTQHEDMIIGLNKITYLEASAEKTTIHLSDQQQIQADRSFRYYTDLFSTLRFYQINNHQMVQLSQINNIEGDGSRALLKNGVKLEVADRRRKDLVSHWKQYR